MRSNARLLSLLLLFLAAPGCSSGSTASTAPGAADQNAGLPNAPSGSGAFGSGESGGGSGSSKTTPATGTSASGGGQGTVQSGTLTAGVWDDNKNFNFFRPYATAGLAKYAADVPPFTIADFEATQATCTATLCPLGTTPLAKTKLDISLIVDTTGSMSDELSYLQKEFEALSASINARYPNAEQRWSLVAYRDVTDEYVVAPTSFTSDLKAFQMELSRYGAGGGGDWPEAPDLALAKASTFAWRSDTATARLAFWVADAPHHSSANQAMKDATFALRDKGVHLYPVASSGVDGALELTMRSMAQLTGGRYIFLTDDSGVGGAHAEPTLPCYFVTKLDKAIMRMVDIELSGTYVEPAAADIIRTGGAPQNGTCTLAAGQSVSAF